MKLINEDKPIYIDYDLKYDGVYRLRWADGAVSMEMYNLTRANDILKNYKQYRHSMRMREQNALLAR